MNSPPKLPAEPDLPSEEVKKAKNKFDKKLSLEIVKVSKPKKRSASSVKSCILTSQAKKNEGGRMATMESFDERDLVL